MLFLPSRLYSLSEFRRLTLEQKVNMRALQMILTYTYGYYVVHFKHYI